MGGTSKRIMCFATISIVCGSLNVCTSWNNKRVGKVEDLWFKCQTANRAVVGHTHLERWKKLNDERS